MSDPDLSPILSLPYLLPSQAQKHVTHNAALRLLDMAVQTVVADRDRSDPPAAPAAGDRHIVASGGTGAWAGHDGEIALWDGGGWQFFAAAAGWQAQVLAEGHAAVFDGSAWALQPPDLDNLDGVGIGTAADATNRLAVASAATLLGHAGDDHRLKINKALAADTASVLFQTGWSGRAEIGTAGADSFSVKVSGDGATWQTGLEIDPDTGKASFPSGVGITGAVTGTALQQSATDTTAGRLMRADYGYGPGNLLGPVSQSAGTPTGAVIERGSNANGSYLRCADGTQICWHQVMGHATVWTFPAAFASASRACSGCVRGGSDTWCSFSSHSAVSATLGLQRADGSNPALVTADVCAVGHWF